MTKDIGEKIYEGHTIPMVTVYMSASSDKTLFLCELPYNNDIGCKGGID